VGVFEGVEVDLLELIMGIETLRSLRLSEEIIARKGAECAKVAGYKLFTILCTPSFIKSTLKLTSNPNFKSVNLKYVNNCL